MSEIFQFFNEIRFKLNIPKIYFVDVVQIIILAIIIYECIIFIKNTQAWTLFKGIIILIVISLVIKLFNFNVLFWIISHSLTILIFTAIVIFQSEIRTALDKLGRKKITKLFFSKAEQISSLYSEQSVTEIVDACYEMAQDKTGALIAIEKDVKLNDFEKTGIKIDAMISKQLIVNAFEHNTPLHDGAMIIRDNRIVAATCYFPLSKNLNINKNLGTRHRAAIGVTEVTDCMCIIISEETGSVNVAIQGVLQEDIEKDKLRNLLETQRRIYMIESRNGFKFIKGLFKREKNAKK